MNASRIGGVAATAALPIAIGLIFSACAPQPGAAPAADTVATLRAINAPALIAPTAKPGDDAVHLEQDAHPMDTDPAYSEYQVAFGELVQRIQGEFPGDYTGHRFNAVHSSGTIIFAGDVPSGAMQWLETVPNVTGVGNAGYTHADRTASEPELYQQVTNTFTGINFLANLDHPSNTLKVSYDATNKSAPAAKALLTEAIAAISRRGTGVKLKMTPFDGPPVTSQPFDSGVSTHTSPRGGPSAASPKG